MKQSEIKVELATEIKSVIKNPFLKMLLSGVIEKILQIVIDWLKGKGLINDSGDTNF